MTKLRTDEALLDALRRAASRPMTRAEEDRQRLSFVMACLPSDSNMTREKVQEVLEHRHAQKVVLADDRI